MPGGLLRGTADAAGVRPPGRSLAGVRAGAGGPGLLKNRSTGVLRYVALGGSLLLLAQGFRVGHSGGELVYVHGAASAYASGIGTTSPAEAIGGEQEREGPE